MDPYLENHLRNLYHYPHVPIPHITYLQKLKNDGFYPSVIYDIGSCVLQWTQIAQKLWPKATIIAFDAFAPAEFLYKEASLDYHIGVLGNEDGKRVKFYYSNQHPGGSSYYKENNDCVFPKHNYVEYTMQTLNTIVKTRGFPLPDLIKIDVQGSEKDILSGATECLKNVKHLIVEMQCVDYNCGAPKVTETLPFIENLGFQCVAPKFSDHGPDADYGFIPSQK